MLYNYHYFEDFVSNYVCMRGSVYMSTVNMVAGGGYQSLGAGVRSNQLLAVQCECWKSNWGPLQEQCVLLTSEPLHCYFIPFYNQGVGWG